MNAKAILSSKGQVVIPKYLREKLGLHSGSEFTIGIRKKGIIELNPVRKNLKSFFGMCKQTATGKEVVSENIDDLIAKAVLENDRR